MEQSIEHILKDYGLWIVTGLCLVIVLFLSLRPRKKTFERRPGADGSAELARLRSQVKDLDARYQAQLEFFISFPSVVKTLTAALSKEQVLSACSRGITNLLNVQNLGIFLAREDGRLLLADGAGIRKEHRMHYSCTVDEAGLREVVENKSVSELKDYPQAVQALEAIGLKCEHGVPLWYGETLMGLLVAGRAHGGPAMVRRVLAMMADLTAVGLNAAGKVSDIKNEAEKDGLTGLANRRVLQAAVIRELQRSRSYGSSASLAMIDVDHFKNYNDQNGHGAGDEVLKTVARLLTESTRRTDLVARYGGEEFTVLLAGADAEQAAQHASRIREAIASHVFPHGEKQPLGIVSISVGVASFPENASDVDSLFKAADTALYQAKENGRNRVEVSVVDGRDPDTKDFLSESTTDLS